jgi:hypothetical protein
VERLATDSLFSSALATLITTTTGKMAAMAEVIFDIQNSLSLEAKQRSMGAIVFIGQARKIKGITSRKVLHDQRNSAQKSAFQRLCA